jgi:3'-phosphoadenosine 5'-phosphosulfate sulfotransferase (PAPS reductase)/FAD synthetase
MTPINVKERIETARDRIIAAVQEFQPIAVFGLFSGGHDSQSALFVTKETGLMTRGVHIHTGIGVEATREHVYNTCVEQNVDLLELKAAENINSKGELDPKVYRELVLQNGFPGPAGHVYMYINLKERALARLARMFGASARGKSKQRIMLVAGCRSQESTRRMGNVKPIEVQGRFIWINPIHDWSKLDTTDLIVHTGMKRNIVVDLIHKSGECLCGAFAKPGELEELKLWPQTRPAYEHIKALECEVRDAGHDWGWGERPPRCSGRKPDDRQLPLCFSCDKFVPGQLNI